MEYSGKIFNISMCLWQIYKNGKRLKENFQKLHIFISHSFLVHDRTLIKSVIYIEMCLKFLEVHPLFFYASVKFFLWTLTTLMSENFANQAIHEIFAYFDGI